MSHDSREAGAGKGPQESTAVSGHSPQVGSRTPVRFGLGVEQIFRYELQGYEPIFSEVTSEFLLYGYRRQARENQYIFVMVQGSRFSGRFVTEVAVSRRPEFPYYKFGDEPRLGVGGVRERVPVLMRGQDMSYRYSNQDELMKALRDVVVGQSAPGIRTLGEMAGTYLYREHQTWSPLYAEWEQAEAAAVPTAEGRRYPGLVNESESYEMLQELLLSRKFDRLLGPMKFRYREPRFFNCHLYLFARGLEFLDPPEGPAPPEPEPEAEESAPGEERPRMITWADIIGPPPKVMDAEARKKADVPPPLSDAIAGVTGRQPQAMALELSYDPTERQREFSFLKSLAAVEAYYEGPAR